MEEKLAERINHIDLAKKTDLFIVAPASANTIAKLAHGMAHNMLTATALALPSTTPKLIAPAMNTKMYENPLTKKNLKILQEVRLPRNSSKIWFTCMRRYRSWRSS